MFVIKAFDKRNNFDVSVQTPFKKVLQINKKM